MMTTTIEAQFNLVSKSYDKNRKKFIPCFDKFYKGTAEIIARLNDNPKTIVDLGAGTGLMSFFLYQYFKQSNFVLVDIAEAMLEVAKQRFNSLDNFSYKTFDYTDDLPFESVSMFVSALSIHHLSDDVKQKLFKNIFDKLSVGGYFVNCDQFNFEDPVISKVIDDKWLSYIKNSDLSDSEYLKWQDRRKFDKECSVEQELMMLKKAGFKNPTCIFSEGKFSVVVAQKQ